MIYLLSVTIMMGTPLLFGALAEVIAERTGMMVTAIEGIFLMGAWAGFVGGYLSGSLTLGFLSAMLAGLLVAALYGWICIYLKQHQVVTGVAINLLAVGLCSFLYRVIFGVPITPLTVNPLATIPIPLLSDIPLLGPILFNQTILTYIIYLLAPLSYFMLYKTSIGLTIRSAGENPEAVDVAGINVLRVRFLTVLLAGVMGGVAGAFYSIGFLGMFTTNIIGGRGWIAFAICFLGNWNPKGAVIGTLAFGFAEAIAIYMQSTGNSALFPNELFIALPYIMTIVLTVSRKSFSVPAKLGVPYVKEN
ncbi:ABC transporter permease [Desulfosporosinus meridiei]|uniref:Putative ABC-type transport system, permease component n=1 Tax=Desulfosporosinus meridiei (strain ATCC BAA-275 / DSM 13257 / KCTC 12902 / NCIMB 13706 / S10) TaxID=768704 RepID=J7IYA8_DESMD|nr:ABC transporter permease [Desulfosporosinus meridiei]AFQ45129.1 putative ABC-type transport system, permease component [Desulfosporosinus meridiei DSM 13257]